MAERTGTMTDRQRVEALLNYQKPDRVPIWPFAYAGFSVVYTKSSIADAYNKPAVALASQRKTCHDFGWVFVPMLSYASLGGWEFGGEIQWPGDEHGQTPVVVRHAVQTPEEAINLKMPDINNSGIIPIMMEFCKLASQESIDNEPFKVMAEGPGAFTCASNITGLDRFALWMVTNPEAIHHLLRLTSDYLVGLAQYWKDVFGVDGVLPLGAEPVSSNNVISPKHFEQFALPYIQETHSKILAMGYKTLYMHICGDHNANLTHWAEIPMGDPGLISIGPDIDLETAAKYFPKAIILGNLDPVIIYTGTPESVYEATRNVIEKGKKLPGGFILGAVCDMPVGAPPVNVFAMARAINDFGWYP